MICIFCKKEIPQTGIDEITHKQAFKCPDCGFTFLGRKVFEKKDFKTVEQQNKIKKQNRQFFNRYKIAEICDIFKNDEKKIIAAVKAEIKKRKNYEKRKNNKRL